MNKTTKNILIIIVIIFCIGILCISLFLVIKNISDARSEMSNLIPKDQNPTSNDSNNDSTETGYGLTIVDDKGTTDSNWYYVTGTLVNNSSNNYEEVIIQYIALDKDGYNLSTCSDIAYNLNSGKSYPFRATCVANKDEVASYKLKNLTPVESIN